MARPRTPTKTLEVRGSFKKDPQRRRKDVECRLPFGEPPASLTKPQRDVWFHLSARIPEGILTGADEPALHLATMLYWEFESSYADFTAAKMARLENLLGKFGMTPADRAKINVGSEKDPKEDDPFAEFAVN